VVQVEDESEFIEAMARMVVPSLPPMAGRMLAHLLVCEPPEQTAGEIADRLRASRGSVSGMARLLEHAGLVRRVTKPGDRREYFSVPPESIRNLMDTSLAQMRRSREVTDAGLALLAGRSVESRSRLQGFRDIYAFFEREWPALLERWHEDQQEQPSGRK